MIRSCIYILWLTFALYPSSLFSQFYIGGQEPASVKWNVIKSKNFRVIFPKSHDSIGRRYAMHIDSVLQLVGEGLNHNPGKFPVVLRSQNALPNGFVSWAPKRTEIGTIGSLDADPDTWISSVSTHELRHIIQIDKLNTSTSKLAYWLLGESGTGLIAGQVPPWFLEGDAVFTETNLGIGGRGRSANFLEPYKTHIKFYGKSVFSYDKWLLGSYKHFTPNHYAFGYLMVGHINENFGPKTWAKALGYVADYPFIPFSFYFGMKKGTGFSRKDIFNASLKNAQAFWNNHSDSGINSERIYITPQQNDFAQYKYSQKINDSTVVALKYTLNRIPEFVLINTKHLSESILHQPGFVTSKIHYKKGFLYWTEYEAHYRFEEISYSNIKRIDVNTKKVETLTHKKRLYNPLVLGNGNIVATGMNEKGDGMIFELDRNGAKVSQLKITGAEPREISAINESGFILRAVNSLGNMILKYPSFSSSPDTLLFAKGWDISNISYAAPWLIFSASLNGNETAFGYNELNNKYFKLFNSIYDLTFPILFSDSTFIASEANINGNRICILPFDTNNKTDIKPLYGNYLFESTFNKQRVIEKDPITSEYKSQRYSKAKGFLNFHSWAPFYYNPNNLGGEELLINPGVTFISQNITGTALTTLGYSYFETHGYHAALSWLGWYPVINISVDQGKFYRRAYGSSIINSATYILEGPMFQGSLGINLPTKLSSNRFYSQLTPGALYSYNNNKIWKGSEYKSGIDYLNLYITFYRFKKMCVRDLRPQWGLSIVGSQTLSLSHVNLIGGSAYFRSSIYLPGLAENHSLLLTNRLERIAKRNYNFSPRSIPPRGYSSLPSFRIINSISADYSLPLLYPDLPLGSLVYLKRIFANAFSDNAYIVNKNERQWINSFGADLNLNLHLFRTRYLFLVGYRLGYIPLTGKSFQSILFNFDLSSISGYNPQQQLFKINL